MYNPVGESLGAALPALEQYKMRWSHPEADLSPKRPEKSPSTPDGPAIGATVPASQVRTALRGFRYPQSRSSAHPLLRFELVARQLRGTASAPSLDARWAALRKVLTALNQRGRARHRVTGITKAEDLTTVEEDAAESVYLWALADKQLNQRDIASALILGKRNMERRLALGIELLAQRLEEAEQEALHALQAGGEESSRQLSVAEEEPPYGIDFTDFTQEERALNALAALRAAVERDESLPTLTSAELDALDARPPETLGAYLLHRLAAWQRHPAFEQHFVTLSLWRDRGGEPGVTAAAEVDQSFPSLEEALDRLRSPMVVLVGEPGSGKTTLLEHLEQNLARRVMRGEADTVPVLIRLGELSHRAATDSGALRNWLARVWKARYPALAPLAELWGAGRVTLLLDGLNEIPHSSLPAYNAYVRTWRACAHEILSINPGNRLLFSCRTLDYTTPLSSRAVRVPRLQIKPLADPVIREYLAARVPDRLDVLWRRIEEAGLRDVLRVPYYLRLFSSVIEEGSEFPTGRASLFAIFVRSALRREIDRGNPLFDPDVLISRDDYLRLTLGREWKGAWELPEHGLLMPALDALAVAMHRMARERETDEAHITRDEASRVIGAGAFELLTAGQHLGLLNYLAAVGHVAFMHLQMQAFFVGRTLAGVPQAHLVEREWRAERLVPVLPQVMEQLHPAEQLPPLSQTGWEEAMLLAVEMAPSPDDYIAQLASFNLAFAGRCAGVPAVARRLSPARVDTLRNDLLQRSQDLDADLRDRIACGEALGDLGDPRFAVQRGPHGEYLAPPLIPIAGGLYPVGDDEPIVTTEGTQTGHQPRHVVRLDSFLIGQFPVTNAEFKRFVDGNGYEDEQWWDTEVAMRWRRGEGVAEARQHGTRDVVEFFRTHRDALERLHEDGTMDEQDYGVMRQYLDMTSSQLTRALKKRFVDGHVTAPNFWTFPAVNKMAQPVVGITWYEARAYCNWLSSQTGRRFRLPREVEWEAAARGQEARLFAYGDTSDPLAANTIETHVRAQTPIGIFPNGTTPEGISDMSGNVWEWTSSAWGTVPHKPAFRYPYNPEDGRENPHTKGAVRRVVRGGSALTVAATSRTSHRGVTLPGLRVLPNGMRVACDLD